MRKHRRSDNPISWGLDRTLYTVAWIAPLFIEAKAALLMLDEKHDGQFSVSRGDDYVFHAGSMCGHNIVIATLPAGQEYGTGSAAALASQVRKSFPNLWFGLLVGIAAGLPNLSRQPPRDIRLGDVLVALPDGDNAGLVAYDLGKNTGDDSFQPLRFGHVLAQTETIVRSAIGKIRLNAVDDAEPFQPYYQQILEQGGSQFRHPGQDHDVLYELDENGIEHKVARMYRSRRERTKVWYGPIGSGEKLMRNSRQRNELRDKYNLIGLEMEAAGTMNRIPVGVIRGVCDYGDEHKNKEWQPYAAAVAAAYAKAVLQEILPDSQDELFFSKVGDSSNDSERGVDTIQQDHFLSQHLSSRPSTSTKRRHIDDELGSIIEDGYAISFKTRRARCSDGLQYNSISNSGSGETLNEDWPEYQTERPGLSAKYLDRCDTPPQLFPGSETWHTTDRRTPRSVLVYGLSGMGKSQICLKAISEQQHRFQSVFYVDASDKTTADSHYLEISRICNIQHHWEDIAVDEQIRITRAWLSCQNEPWLLMIDNARGASLPLSRYVPTGGCGTILITSDESQWATGCHTHCQISSMSDDQAFELLLKYKDPGTKLDELEIESARMIAVQRLGGMPLAIAQAGSYIFNNHCTYSEYLEELQEFPQELLNKEPPLWLYSAKLPITVWSTLKMTIRRIQVLPERGSAAAIELLGIMSFLHNDGIDDRMFQEARQNMQEAPLVSRPLGLLDLSKHGWDTRTIRAAIGILRRYSLLAPPSFSKRQYSLHNVVQTVCRIILAADEKSCYSFQAMSLVATALVGIKTPLSWIEDPAGLKLQKLLLPHVTSGFQLLLPYATPTHRRLNVRGEWILDDLGCEDVEMVLEFISLFAKAYAATGHYRDAKTLIVDSCSKLRARQVFDDSLRIVPKLREQEASYSAQLGEHMEAHLLRQRIHTERERLGPIGSQDHCAAMMNLADSAWAVGKRREALLLSEKCLDLREKTLSPQDSRLSRTRRKVAEFLHGLNLRRRALDLRELTFQNAMLKDLPTDSQLLDFLATKTALADSYQWDGRYLQALQLRKDVYEGRNNILGPDHPETLLAHDRLLITQSSLTNEQGEQQKLCQLWEKSAIIWKRTLGESHPHTLEAKVNLGRAYSKLQDFTKAIGQQESVLLQRKQAYDTSSPDSKRSHLFPYLSSMGQLASLFGNTGQLSNACKMRFNAAKLAERHCGLSDPVTFTAFNKLLNSEASIDQITSEELIQKRQKLMSDQKGFLGQETTQAPRLMETRSSIFETMSFLAVDLERAGHEFKAIDLRRELMAAQRVSLGPENRETLSNMRRLALMLAAKPTSSLAQVQEGIKLLEEIEAVQQRLLGSDSFQARDTHAELSHIRSTSHFETSARIRGSDIPGSDSCLSHITNSSDRVIQDGRENREDGASDNSFDKLYGSHRPRGYLRSLLPKTKRRRKPVRYSDSSGENCSGESGSEMSDG